MNSLISQQKKTVAYLVNHCRRQRGKIQQQSVLPLPVQSIYRHSNKPLFVCAQKRYLFKNSLFQNYLIFCFNKSKKLKKTYKQSIHVYLGCQDSLAYALSLIEEFLERNKTKKYLLFL